MSTASRRVPFGLTLLLILAYLGSACAWGYAAYRDHCLQMLEQAGAKPVLGGPISNAVFPLFHRWPSSTHSLLSWARCMDPLWRVTIPKGADAGRLLKYVEVLGAENVWFDQASVQDADLSAFRSSGWHRLEGLEIHDCPVGIRGLRHLGHCPGLTELRMSRCRLNGVEAAELLDLLPQLKFWHATHCPIDSDVAEALARCEHLTWVKLSSTLVDDRLLAGLQGTAHRWNWLELDDTHVTDRGITESDVCRAVERLDVRTPGVTGDGLVKLLARPHRIKMLCIDPRQITPGLIEALRDWPPGLAFSVPSVTDGRLFTTTEQLEEILNATVEQARKPRIYTVAEPP